MALSFRYPERLIMEQRARDLTVLLARLVVGATFLAHAYQKFVINGIDDVATGFGKMGLPAPAVAAWFTALVEVCGGLALILGVLLPVAGVLLAAVMIGALATAHLSSGFFATDGGFEYVLVLAAVSLALGFSGPRYTLTGLLRGNRQVAEG
ncbi:putative oxidoreductase [Saccharopolyspora erythraea NRRL 2338]|uniref:DoxX family protein n=2 Tax=Saccharopolyspora erythraea TaxID=1836 RepID=A4FNM8_SACEN|nr:DoxX family protein [Saccharopolyspora erythraea]EQD84055.1 membrane protein [Saccharopolyspora erythraea D]PFG99291.1 putative oxidoreductase [Saccharopolyspora erythraea NRRL 2338]CAM05653.1 DoxX family protein [Saccharopolyspora erythraea NRRL 2338]